MRRIPGVVVDGMGRGVAGAAVGVAWGTAPTPEMSIRTDQSGKFALALPEGKFRVEAHAADGRHGSIEIDATDPALVELKVRLGN